MGCAGVCLLAVHVAAQPNEAIGMMSSRIAVRPVNHGQRPGSCTMSPQTSMRSPAGRAARGDADVVDDLRRPALVCTSKARHGVGARAKEKARCRRTVAVKSTRARAIAGVCGSQVHRRSITPAHRPTRAARNLRREMT